jgi:hypothetical protein
MADKKWSQLGSLERRSYLLWTRGILASFLGPLHSYYEVSDIACSDAWIYAILGIVARDIYCILISSNTNKAT